MPVKTAKVAGRRKVSYASLQDVVADAERLSAAKVTTLGNWSAGQVFQHLAAAYNGSIDGLPGKFPWHIRLVANLFKNRLLRGAMPAGIEVPADLAKAVMPNPTSTEAGLAELRAAVARLERDPHRARHPLFGDMSHEQWNQVHLNHAALHMSFLTLE
jgi:hypothetical protein